MPVLPRGRDRAGDVRWGCVRRVTLPWVSNGIVGAVVLGLGRASGETMAVAMVSGAVLGAMRGIYTTDHHPAATIVSQYQFFAVKTLAEVGLCDGDHVAD